MEKYACPLTAESQAAKTKKLRAGTELDKFILLNAKTPPASPALPAVDLQFKAPAIAEALLRYFFNTQDNASFTLHIQYMRHGGFCQYLFAKNRPRFCRLAMGHFGLDKAADLIYDNAEGCCPEKWGGGGCPEEEI